MPNRIYYPPKHRPIRRLDHIVAHPAEFGVAVWWVVAGLVAAAEVITKDRILDSSVGFFPIVFTAIIAGLILIGSSMILWGITTLKTDLRKIYGAIISGCVFAGAGWLAYAVLVIFTVPLNVMASIFALMNTSISVLVIAASIKTDSLTREMMKEQGYEA